MRTPSGAECPFFYGNYFRGRKDEECRLIGDQPPPDQWTADLCKTCPVPAISRANACQNLVLHGKVASSFLGLRHKVRVTATCNFTHDTVTEPEIGCGHCHEMLNIVLDEDK